MGFVRIFDLIKGGDVHGDFMGHSDVERRLLMGLFEWRCWTGHHREINKRPSQRGELPPTNHCSSDGKNCIPGVEIRFFVGQVPMLDEIADFLAGETVACSVQRWSVWISTCAKNMWSKSQSFFG